MRAISEEPPLLLAEAASRGVPRVRLACAKCGRRGDYCVDRLLERFGDLTLIQVRETLSADCTGATRATRPTIAGRFSNGEARLNLTAQVERLLRSMSSAHRF
jgi:hypothetical protein